MTNETNIEQIKILEQYFTLARRGMYKADWLEELSGKLRALTPQGDETAQGEYQKLGKVDFYSALKEYEKEDPMFVPPLLKNYMLGFFDWLLKRQDRTAEQKGEGEKAAEFWQNAWSRVVDLSKERKKTIAALKSRITALEAENKRLREGWVSVETIHARCPECEHDFDINLPKGTFRPFPPHPTRANG
jgi:hypothetical protein